MRPLSLILALALPLFAPAAVKTKKKPPAKTAVPASKPSRAATSNATRNRMFTRCEHKDSKGVQCSARALRSSPYCAQHQRKR